MTAFVLLAAALTVIVASAVAFGLLRAPRSHGQSADEINAAIYREQVAEIDAALQDGALSRETHAQARDAIRARLALDLSATPEAAMRAPNLWMPIASVLFVCASAPLLYAALGNPSAMKPAPAPAVQRPGHTLEAAQMAARVEALARRLERNPEDLEGWIMLGRSYSAMGRFGAAAMAFGEASKRAPRDANILADRADVLAMAAGRRFEGEPDALVARALQVDPAHRKALALAGSSAFARHDYAKAAGFWTRLREQLPADSEAASRVDANIARAKDALGR